MGIVSDKGAGNFASPDRYRYTQGVVNFGMGCWEFRWYRVPVRYLPYLGTYRYLGTYLTYGTEVGTVGTGTVGVRYLHT